MDYIAWTSVAFIVSKVGGADIRVSGSADRWSCRFRRGSGEENGFGWVEREGRMGDSEKGVVVRVGEGGMGEMLLDGFGEVVLG
ncbi:GGDEF domain-containing protein [Sesbania bispinosa]|nr:GGDEF domain-containing protein [Sesbania bispinosa]